MSTLIYNKCKKHQCVCQRFRPKEYIIDECFFCNHSVGFHETSSIVDSSEFPYGLCNEPECGCQRFKNQNLDNLRCIYCNHYEGFHSSWEITSNININPTTLLNNLQSNLNPTTSTIASTSNRYINPRAEVIANFRPTQVSIVFNTITIYT